MIRLSILALIFVTITSCSSYTVARYEVENVLAVTKAGGYSTGTPFGT